jgi:hypothetical protein
VSDLSPDTRALLDRARLADAMPRRHRVAMRRRLAAALGMAVPVAVSATTAASAGAWIVRGLAIVSAVGVVRTAVTVSAPAAIPSTHLAAAASSHVNHIVARPAPLPAVIASASPPPAPAGVVEAPPVVSRPAPPPPPRTSARAPVVDTHGSVPDRLAAEVNLLRDARQALKQGDAARAIARLEEHRSHFGGGSLVPEADALRVEALCMAGRTEEAAIEARDFVARRPDSPLARRFASTCARDAARTFAP